MRVLVMGRLANRWVGKESLAAADARRVGFVTDSGGPRLLLFAAPGMEEVNPVRTDVNSAVGVIPLVAVEVGADSGDCATDVQPDALQPCLI